ncbi:hypothetical protein ASE86_13335 [Sphingomonas sp. Leaf33]|uniref:hypothetical protein n=1 Tax=Sphingomonas sp. Leaf33 TaxID=1736215 RepID=UPI0006F2337D|nr:hypothetical protein [Sphingomonas sp. Leaf33]KQN19449.1 hypothetical protein ASE86_13335 [Sphingomonas sp. Leaf33]
MKHAVFHPARADRFHRLLATLSPNEVGDAIDALIARLDALGGDPDLEEDDHAGGNVDDVGEAGTLPESDLGCVGVHFSSDDDDEGDLEDRRLRMPHIKRIQRTRCDRHVGRWGNVTHLLRDQRAGDLRQGVRA